MVVMVVMVVMAAMVVAVAIADNVRSNHVASHVGSLKGMHSPGQLHYDPPSTSTPHSPAHQLQHPRHARPSTGAVRDRLDTPSTRTLTACTCACTWRVLCPYLAGLPLHRAARDGGVGVGGLCGDRAAAVAGAPRAGHPVEHVCPGHGADREQGCGATSTSFEPFITHLLMSCQHQLYMTTHTACDMAYFVSMLIGCWLVLAIRWYVQFTSQGSRRSSCRPLSTSRGRWVKKNKKNRYWYHCALGDA